MKTNEEFPFEKISKMDPKNIDFTDIQLLNACSITPLTNNKTVDELIILGYKNEIQNKIITFQYDRLEEIYDGICSKSNNNKVLYIDEKKLLDDLDHTNDDTTRQYSNLDLLTLHKKYRIAYPNTTQKERIAESLYIRNLLIITGIQRILVQQQHNLMAYLYELRISERFNQRKTKLIENASTIDLPKIKSLDRLIMCNTSNIPDQKKKKKKRSKKKKSVNPINIPKQDKNDCCICFSPIEQKISLIPCGHTTVCSHCVENSCGKKCPICREEIVQYIKIYL